MAENNKNETKVSQEAYKRNLVDKIEEIVSSYIDKEKEKEEKAKLAEKEQYCFAALANKTGVGLYEAIVAINNSDATKNGKLMETVKQYEEAIKHGLYEERLYETFMHNLSAYTYMTEVEDVLKKLKKNVAKNKTCIEITKLLEEMSESTSAHLLPIIEEDCARFAMHPCAENKMQLRNCLMQYVTDPYCNEILDLVCKDNSIEGNHVSENEVIDFKDTIKIIREKACTSSLFSPVQFIKEGECIFAVNGTYFVKKSNSISKLDTEHVNSLSEKFVVLANLCNDPAVTITDDKIVLEGNEKIAEIYEDYVLINGHKECKESLRNLQEMNMRYDYDTNFFIMCSCLHENFDNIAKINFGTHIALKNNPGLNVDMFRLGDNIFINTVNEAINQSTFFHNVNPIQCKNIINNHMGINVSSLFENLLPKQQKLIKQLNETQNEYLTSINKLEDTIEKLKETKKNTKDEKAVAKLEKGLETAKEKLSDLKAEYKKWTKQVEDETGEEIEDSIEDEEVNADGDVRKETTDEPIKADDVEDEMDELTSPINTNELPMDLTNDEVEEYLDSDDMEESDEEDDDMLDGINPEDFEEDLKKSFEDEMEEPDNETEEELPVEDDNVFDTEENEPVEDGGFDEISDDEMDVLFDENDEETAENDEDIITDEVEDDEMDDIFDESNDNDTLEVTVDNIATITSVRFDENVKTGEKYKSGVINVTTPMVSPQGDIYTDVTAFIFYLNDDNEPVIDSTNDINLNLYDAMVSRIKEDAMYNVVVNKGVDKNTNVTPETKVNLNEPVEVEDENEVTDYMVNDLDLVDDDPNTVDNVDELIDEPALTDDDFDYDVDAYAQLFDEEPSTIEEPKSVQKEVKIGDDTFNVSDEEDEFAVTPVEDDFNDGDENEEEFDFNDGDDEEDEIPFIPTYKEGDTEIELPAANVDKTSIKEKKEPINEKRNKIMGVRSRFFVNEGTVKPSNVNRSINASLVEKVNGVNGANGLLKECIHPVTINIQYMREYAQNLAYIAEQTSGNIFEIGELSNYLENIEDVIDYYQPYYFTIYSHNNEEEYAIYQCEGEVYYRPFEEFVSIINDLKDEVPGQTTAALMFEYMEDKELEPISTTSVSDWKYTIRAIMQSMIGEVIPSEELNEKCKIRKTKLSSGGDFLSSKQADDILHGDKEERDFHSEIDKESKAAGIPNPLLGGQQQEAWEPVLPNQHRSLSESEELLNETDDLEPDTEYSNDLNKDDNEFTSLNNPSNGNNPEDLKTVKCNIVVDGYALTTNESYVYLEDIINSKKNVRVISEDFDGNKTVETLDINSNIKFTEYPYAVIVNKEGEPIRKIRINPLSYVNAMDEDMVECYVADKKSQYPKHCIKILS